MRILGIDPGSRLTGFGCVDLKSRQILHVDHGTLVLNRESPARALELHERLLELDRQLSVLISDLNPTVIAIEKVFFTKNALSALKLGQARGVAIVCGMRQGLQFAEYSPAEIKQAVAGHGRADKIQVAKMVQVILGKKEFATHDASDALALAICHAQNLLFSNARRAIPEAPQKKSRRLSLAQSVRHRLHLKDR